MRDVVIHIQRGGTSVVFECSQSAAPAVVHWGGAIDLTDERDLDFAAASALPSVGHSSFDAPRRVSLLASRDDGWAGAAGFSAEVDGHRLVGFRTVAAKAEEHRAIFTLRDPSDAAEVVIDCRLTDGGLLLVLTSVENVSSHGCITISALRTLLPLPARASEVLSLTGRWSLERQPQRINLGFGRLQRGGLRGRPGHDSPLVFSAGTESFGWEGGEIWGVHIGWSGSAEHIVERLPEGAGAHRAMLGGGVILDEEPIEVAPGQRYLAPAAHFVYSDSGLNGVADAFHSYVRASQSAGRRPRPVILNTWEASYFDLDVESLRDLADQAAELGVERFVIDDGWFLHRRSSDAGLGDWYVDESVWHGQLPALAEHIRLRGMEFGLWFEPEMVNPDSDLARTHPDWILGGDVRRRTWRGQQPLDLSIAAVRDHLVDRISALVTELGIAYIKWDHNREVVLPLDDTRRWAGHAQTEGLYDVLRRITARHPGLEIESCASGGARIDLGMLPYVERFWTSDTNDPLERQTIQRWTGLLVPPEMLGSHVGPDVAHTTQRATSLEFRLITAFFGHTGIEWDIRELDDAARQRVKEWISEHKRLRSLLHGGRAVVADLDNGQSLHGVVSEEADHALFAWVRESSAVASTAERIRFPGLDPRRRYRMRRLFSDAAVRGPVDTQPPWFVPIETGGCVDVSGAVLTKLGVPLPLLHPASAIVLELVALPEPG